ncbi:MAG: YqhA family protein [Deltaproteobacteria bacterium]|nr:YqhA family protein [Deltaproteobacteria bacterium]MBZ0219439.1 YqhA family protein [Deltaproteobacteria bacterium]
MDRILSASRYLVIIPVVVMLFASAAAFLWGGYRTVVVLMHLVSTAGTSEEGHAIIELIPIMDTFLIATGLLIFAVGMYELFIGKVQLPAWLIIHDLHDLKAKLGSVIILVMAVAFLENLIHWKNAWETLLFATGIAVVSAVLIAFNYYMGKD